MKWTINHPSNVTNRSAFTLIELLAAMAFMAIVIPVAMQGLTIASRAGEVSQRKMVATRVCDSVLNEYLAKSQLVTTGQKGVVQEGAIDYRWNIRTVTWREDSMRVVTAEVTYPVQGRDYTVTASTLIGLITQ